MAKAQTLPSLYPDLEDDDQDLPLVPQSAQAPQSLTSLLPTVGVPTDSKLPASLNGNGISVLSYLSPVAADKDQQSAVGQVMDQSKPAGALPGVGADVPAMDPNTGDYTRIQHLNTILPTADESLGKGPMSVLPPVSQPTVTSRQEQMAENQEDRLERDQNRLDQLNTPWDKSAHGFFGNLGHALGQSTAGTRAGNAARLAGAEDAVKNDATVLDQMRATQDAQKKTDYAQANHNQDEPAILAHTNAETKELGAPKSEFELWQQQNPNGTPLQYHQAMVAPQSAAAAQRRTQQWAPVLKRLGLPEDMFNTPDMTEADAVDAEKDLKTQLGANNQDERLQALVARQNSAGANIGTWSLQNGQDADGNPIPVLLNSKTGESKPAPAGVMPKGTATADEKKRADLSANLINLSEEVREISQRRPDLFGPINGRKTQLKIALGVDNGDADIGKLGSLYHQMGIVVNSAHSMRSAAGVGAAGDAVLNHFYNDPKALGGSLDEVERSARQFIHQANTPGQDRTKSIDRPGDNNAVGTTHDYVVDGRTYYGVPDGDEKSKFLKRFPNAKVK